VLYALVRKKVPDTSPPFPAVGFCSRPLALFEPALLAPAALNDPALYAGHGLKMVGPLSAG
jgi:hypothetical protein